LNVADIKIVVCVQRNAVRLFELRLVRRAAIAAESRHPRACQGGDQARASIDAADHMRVPLGDQHVASAVKADLMGRAELCHLCGPAVTRMAFDPIARDHR